MQRPPTLAADLAELSFEQSLHEGPSAAIEHFRARWDAFARSSSRFMEEGDELPPMILGLSRVFASGGDSSAGSTVELEIPEDVWRASVRTELPVLLLEIIMDDRFFLQNSVSALLA